MLKYVHILIVEYSFGTSLGGASSLAIYAWNFLLAPYGPYLGLDMSTYRGFTHTGKPEVTGQGKSSDLRSKEWGRSHP